MNKKQAEEKAKQIVESMAMAGACLDFDWENGECLLDGHFILGTLATALLEVQRETAEELARYIEDGCLCENRCTYTQVAEAIRQRFLGEP